MIVWFALLAIKIIAGVFLHSQAVDQVIHYQKLQTQAKNEIFRRRMLLQKSKSAPGSPRLSLIDFSGIFLIVIIKTDKIIFRCFNASYLRAKNINSIRYVSTFR